jgi:bifunctional oligoribonuclease and PAP phosphatase NrnA
MISFKICARRIWKEIDRSKSILLHLHPGPDGDSVGSALAFYHALIRAGKNVTLIQGDSLLPQNLSHLPGTNKIVTKNINQMDLSTFDLFIILDSASFNQITKLNNFKLPKRLKTIVIDHHQSNEKFGKINMVIPNSPATAQIVYDFLVYRKIKITPQIAACLFIGIFTDTGGF